MKKALKITFLIIVLCLGAVLSSCSDNGEEKTTENKVINIDKDKLPYSEEEIYSQLFDINNKIEVDIDISDETLLQIQKDYEKYSEKGAKSPIYREAAVNITINTDKSSYTYHIDEVGVRMKGNTSRVDFYSEEEGQYNLIHLKLDFQETFDNAEYYEEVKDWSEDEAGLEARKDRTFATLEKMEIKWNKMDDSTYIREYYTYEMYRDYGVLAPHINLASMDMGGLHLGVFTIYEPVDKVFIEKYVAEEDQGGDLYKCGWTRNGANFLSNCSIGIEDEATGRIFNYDLKTNKKTSGNTELEALIRKFSVAEYTGDIEKEDIEQLIDMDNFLKFAAISYFTGNPDDVRNNYNNYYIYFLKSSGKMVFIPYDMDRCFGLTKEWNPSGNGLTTVDPFTTLAAGANAEQLNPIFNYTVSYGGFYVDEYAEVLEEIATGKWLTLENFESYYNIAMENYKDDTSPDKKFYNADRHNFSFDLDRSVGLGTTEGNASFKVYIDEKLKAYEKYVK